MITPRVGRGNLLNKMLLVFGLTEGLIDKVKLVVECVDVMTVRVVE